MNANASAFARALVYLALLGLAVLLAGGLVEGIKRAVPVRIK